MSHLHYSTSADESVFYQIVSKQFENLWKSATTNQRTICIPPDDDVRYFYSCFSRDNQRVQLFIRNHILQDSPYFVGQYTTESGKVLTESDELKKLQDRAMKSRSLSFVSLRKMLDTIGSAVGTSSSLSSSMDTERQLAEANMNIMKTLETTDGFRSRFAINVIGTETVYNDNFQPFTILFVDKCIFDDHAQIRQLAVKNFGNKRFSVSHHKPKEPTNDQEFHEFLKQSDPDLYSSCMRHIVTFNKSYVLMSGYKKQAIERITQLYKQLLNDYILPNNNMGSSGNNDQYVTSLKNSAMGILCSGIYDKVFPFWVREHTQDDQKMYAYQITLSNLTLDDFAVPKSFQCSQDSAIYVLRTIDDCRSAFEKMKCLKTTSDLIMKTVNKHQEESNTGKQEVFTSDELLPILTYVICQSKLSHLSSNLAYMTEFSIDEMMSTEYGYAMTSFEVALEYMKKRAIDLGVAEVDIPPPVVEEKKRMSLALPIQQQRFSDMSRPHTHRGVIPVREKKETGLCSSIDENYMDHLVASPMSKLSSSTSPPTLSRTEVPKRKLSRRTPSSIDIINAFAHRVVDSDEESDESSSSEEQPSSSPVVAPPTRIVLNKQRPLVEKK